MTSYVSLNLNKDFQRLYHRGKSSAQPVLVVYAMKNRAGVCRVGITTGKKIGCAVERNRSRRIIRAAFQSVLKSGRIKGSWDFVFVARAKTKFQKSTRIESAMLASFEQLGVVEASS